MDRLKDKTALITGASRGIGRGIVEAFAHEGAELFLVARSGSLDEAVKRCKDLGLKVEGLAGDVGDPGFAKAAVDKCVEVFGKLDILVNNAGITRDGLLVRMKEADFDEVIRVNLKGVYGFMQAASQVMMKKRSGRIINITSIVGQIGNAGQVNYAASKAGIIGMTMSAAKELASRGVTVNAIAPGFIATDMTDTLPEKVKEKLMESIPMGRFGSVSDVAAAALYLASADGEYVTGQVLSINGGMAMGV
jgi:3-oxoacyl-[acyl-carrier protein] reductase